MNIIDVLNNRYSVKQFNKEKKISKEDIIKVQELLLKSPSSLNAQPWEFLIATTDDVKQTIAKSTINAGFNTQKILDASAIIVFCVKNNIDEKYLEKILDKEDKDGRYLKKQYKEDMKNAREEFVNFHKNILKDQKDWLEKQVYLNIGHFTLGSAILGLDSVIMEGFDKDVISKELLLSQKDLRPVALVAIGYKDEEDFNAKLPKSRLSKEDLITLL